MYETTSFGSILFLPTMMINMHLFRISTSPKIIRKGMNFFSNILSIHKIGQWCERYSQKNKIIFRVTIFQFAVFRIITMKNNIKMDYLSHHFLLLFIQFQSDTFSICLSAYNLFGACIVLLNKHYLYQFYSNQLFESN